MTSPQRALMDKAEEYAAKGMHVFPLKVNDKQPANSHGFKDATTSKEVIKTYWTAAPYNIGLATGEVNNLVVVDVDDEQTWATFLATQAEGLPIGPKVKTGKGQHLYFSYPAGRSIRNKQKAGMGFDIRANGGYIVAPPSIHPNGSVYEFTTTEEERPELPEWLLELIAEPKEAAKTKVDFNASIPAANDPSPYGMQALENECQAIVSAPQGTRNDRLNKACFSIGGLVAGGEIDNYLALNYLTQAAQQSGLPTEEIAKTLASGFKAGKDNPRTAPEAQGSISQGVAELLTWDQPNELKAELLPVKSLDPAMLPDSMRDYITDIAERMDNSPPDYVAVGVMVALATLIGRKLSILPKRYDPWLVVPNLWGAAIGRPSAKKTPSLTSAMAPLHTFESEQFQKHGIAMGKYSQQVKVAKVSLKANEKKLKIQIEKGKQEEGENSD